MCSVGAAGGSVETVQLPDIIRWCLRKALIGLLLGAAAIGGYYLLRPRPSSGAAMNEIAALLASVRVASFPQLKDVDIALEPMNSDYIYFESQFTLSSLLFSRQLHYRLLYNPAVFARQAPRDGLRAILAHELAHIDYFHRQSRMGLVSLVRLLSTRFASRFERGADLRAIGLGYGPGLESYRGWLYRNVPPSRMEEKRRDYFSPEEIEAILQAVQQDPAIGSALSTCVPRSLGAIERLSRSPGGPCPD
jgi:hypothetical protein